MDHPPYTNGSKFVQRISLILSALLVSIVGWNCLPEQTIVAENRANTNSPAFSASVTAYSLRSNAVVLHPQTGKIYASIPGVADPRGNSIARIDPATGTIEHSVWVGSEPNKLALTNDGTTLYVGLNGPRAIRRYDIASETPGAQFYVGSTPFDGPLRVLDLAISPTNNNVVAVSRASGPTSPTSVGVAVYDNGVQRPLVGGQSQGLTFTDSEAILFGTRFNVSMTFERLAVDATGVTSSTQITSLSGGRSIRFAEGRVYSATGHVSAAPSGELVATLQLASNPHERVLVIDTASRRAIYAASTQYEIMIEAFDIDSFARIGSITVPNPLEGQPMSITRWGTNGVAISLHNGPTYFVRSDLIGPGDIPSPAPTPTPATSDLGAIVRRVNIHHNDLIYNGLDEKLYVSVPSSSGPPLGNTITRIDPVSGTILSSSVVGSDPNKLAVSDDGTTIYASLDGEGAIRRFHTNTQTAGLWFLRENSHQPLSDLLVFPGNPQTVAVSSIAGGTAVYDNAIRRSASLNIGIGQIEHNGTPNVIYGTNPLFIAYKLAVNQDGLTVVNETRNLVYNRPILFAGGRLYSTDGRVVAPETRQFVGQFILKNGTGTSDSVAVDPMAGKAFFVSTNGASIEVFDIHSFNKLGTIVWPFDPNFGSSATNLSRWGRNGLAFRQPIDPGGSYIKLIQSPLVAEAKPFDFDADGKTDIAIFRPSVAEWWIKRSSTDSVSAAQFGSPGDMIVPADFSGDTHADMAVWRPETGEWFVLRSQDFSYYSVPFGSTGDIPAPADYDADGRADTAVFRPSTATWYISRSSGGTTIEQFGANGDWPVVADYDDDGRADIAIYRPSVSQWWLNRSTAGVLAFGFGGAGDKPVQGDFTGDGKADIALWRPLTGEWFVVRSENYSYFSFPFGANGDLPAPGDFDGDGRFDATVFRPSNGTWYSNRSTAGILIQQFGITGDRPVPNAFVP